MKRKMHNIIFLGLLVSVICPILFLVYHQNNQYVPPDQFVDKIITLVISETHPSPRPPVSSKRLHWISDYKNGWLTAEDLHDQVRDFLKQQNSADAVINRVYFDLLGRPADLIMMERLAVKIIDGELTEAQLRESLENTEEYEKKLYREEVTAAFTNVLGRDPETSVLNNLVDRMMKKELTVKVLKKDLEGSDEYERLQVKKSVDRLYKDLLEREPSTKEISLLLNRLLDPKEKFSERQLGKDIKNSVEYRRLQEKKKVIMAYVDLLEREPSTKEISPLVNRMLDPKEKLSERHLRKDIKNSVEYKNLQ